MSKLTQKAMAQALADLLQTKPLDKITIRDITDKCGLTRNTFYYHFHDVYDLLRWFFMELTDEVMSKYQDEADWEGGLEETLEYLYDHRQMVLHIIESINDDILFRFVDEVIYHHAQAIVAQKAKGMDVSQEAIDIAADFYMYAAVGNVRSWIMNGLDRTPEHLAQVYNTFLQGTAKSILLSAEEASKID